MAVRVAGPEALALEWWWYAIYGVLVVAGIVAQVTATARFEASLREQWEASGGRALRTAGPRSGDG